MLLFFGFNELKSECVTTGWLGLVADRVQHAMDTACRVST